MDIIEKILGFDVRKSLSAPFQWDKNRKNAYLIKKDILLPLSVDFNVWEQDLTQLDSPETLEVNYLGFYNNLESLRRNKNGHDCSIIAIALCMDAQTVHKVSKTFMIPNTKPDEKEEKWKALGFDVTDSGLLSALSNYGNSEAMNSYGKHFNTFHLLKDYSSAKSFAETFKNISQEKDNFYVLKLYLINNDFLEIT